MAKPPENKVQVLSKPEMKCKLSGVNLSDYKAIRIKFSHNHIVVHKREHGLRYEDLDGNTKAIIYIYVGADGEEEISPRLLVIDDTTYILATVPLPPCLK
jgi:hypothetical protein